MSKIQLRRDTAANWTSANPTLASGELGFETDTGKFKIGNAAGTAWTSLAYAAAAAWSDISGKPSFATVATSGSYNDLTDKPSAYSLPVASSSTLGGVKIGSGVSVDANGYITVSTSYAGTGANIFSGTQSFGGNLLVQPKLQSYRETFTTPAISSGTLTLDLSGSNFFKVSLNAAITTLSIINTPASSAASFTLEFTADGTARVVAWPASVKWPGGIAPTLTSTSSKTDTFVFYSTDSGTTWKAFITGQNQS